MMPADKMEFQDLSPKIPAVKAWILDLLKTCDTWKRPVADYGFKRLPDYFPEHFLENTWFVVSNECPLPPLKDFGLEAMPGFEFGVVQGITYLDTYFVRRGNEASESLHFHELVHVAQWRHLGMDRFIENYAMGLIMHGYFNCPFEVMASRFEDRFDTHGKPFDVIDDVQKELDQMKGDFL